MRIILPNNGVAQFCAIQVICSDNVMAEILSCRREFPERHIAGFKKAISEFRSGKESFFEYMFGSGAKLKIDRRKNRFYIYCYHYAGKDGLRAVEELKLCYDLRTVFKRMQKFEATREYRTSNREISISSFFDLH